MSASHRAEWVVREAWTRSGTRKTDTGSVHHKNEWSGNSQQILTETVLSVLECGFDSGASVKTTEKRSWHVRRSAAGDTASVFSSESEPEELHFRNRGPITARFTDLLDVWETVDCGLRGG